MRRPPVSDKSYGQVHVSINLTTFAWMVLVDTFVSAQAPDLNLIGPKVGARVWM
jgi:hypothetical protein